MQKTTLFFILLLWLGIGFSQTHITYVHDLENKFSKETIANAPFKEFQNPINNGLKNGLYWFKITNIASEKTTIQIPNNRITDAVAYQENNVVHPSKNERFRTFKIENNATVYLKLNVTREALIPIEVKKTEAFLKDEKSSVLFLGFYYGFAFVIILINLFYYINFKDTTFLYYGFFLLAISFGLSISDGIYDFYNFSEKTIAALEVIDHFLVVIFIILFGSKYLQTDDYYPKSKTLGFSIAALVLLFGSMYLLQKNHLWYVFMELFVFITLTYYWTIAIVLFKKNLYTKIFVIAYFFILPLGISFYITKLLAIPIIISGSHLKFGAFFEMLVLSFAVIYRMKILHQENTIMREEIILYAEEIKDLSEELQKTSKTATQNSQYENLTIREHEILNLIIKGKSNKEIAEKLNISINTVKYHVKNIYDKLHIKSRREVKNFAVLP